jgi:hypothetical protein
MLPSRLHNLSCDNLAIYRVFPYQKQVKNPDKDGSIRFLVRLASTIARPMFRPRVFLFFEEYAGLEAIVAQNRSPGEPCSNLGEFFDERSVVEYFDKIAF